MEGGILSDRPLFTGDICQLCDQRRRETETGEPYCLATPDASFDCGLHGDLATLEHVARQTAQLLHRITDRTLRRQVVEKTAEGFSEACYLQGRGVSFDESGFCELAGVPRGASA